MSQVQGAGLKARTIAAMLAATLVVAAIGVAAWWGYGAVLAQPVKHVSFAGEVDRLHRPDLEALAQAIQAAPAGGASLESIREAARRVPWVREVSVRRQFPDTIQITLQAHEAFAHWNDGQLVSRRGEVFTAEDTPALPQFRGPDGSAAAMVAQFAPLANALAPLASAIAELRLSPRGAWQVVLESGLSVDLGHDDIVPRAERFAAAWPQATARVQKIRYADLRYPNGFALGSDPIRKK